MFPAEKRMKMKSENRPVAEKLKVPDNEKNVLMFSNDNLSFYAASNS